MQKFLDHEKKEDPENTPVADLEESIFEIDEETGEVIDYTDDDEDEKDEDDEDKDNEDDEISTDETDGDEE